MRSTLFLFAMIAAAGVASACTSPADSLLDLHAGGGNGGQPTAPGGTADDATTTIAGASPIAAVPIRRLNRAEYNNTVRDLVGDLSSPAAAFPEDTLRGGFSNNADALTLSPLQVELYATAAEKIVASAMGSVRRGTIVTCDPNAAAGAEACARSSLQAFATRAYRRPVATEDVDALVALFRASQAAGDTFDEAMSVALRAVLTSPSFLFRIEDQGGEGPQGSPVDAYAMASRLSYFLWSSMPDEALFKAAANGELVTKEQIDAQAQRMLEDPKSQALIDNFGGEWILAKIAEAAPAKESFPAYDDALKASMVGETKAFLASFILQDRNLKEALTATDTFVDARLASYYGVTPPSGAGFTRVTLPASSHRGGLLTQASILTMTSIATRGSPTRRGAWILENLMCAPPAPPPPNTPELPAVGTTTGTLRQTLEAHRKNPACAGCHALMDPLGLSLEHFDGIGGYRDQDNGQPIDATGTLPDGRTIDGNQQLASILAEDPRFVTCAATKLFAYARGREVPSSDATTSAGVAKVLATSGYRLKDLARQIVNDVSFRNRAR